MGKEKSAREKIEVQRIPWLLVIVTIVLTNFLFTCGIAFVPARLHALFNLAWMYGNRNAWNAGPYLILFLIFLVTQAIPRIRMRINTANLSLVFAASMISLAFGNSFYPWQYLECWFNIRTQPTWANYLPSFWGPSTNVYKDLIAAKADLVQFVPIIGFWSIFVIVWYFFFASLTSIVRRLWMDTEKLPFPYNELPIMMIKETVGAKEASASTTGKRIFYVAALIGFISYLPVQLNILFPWFPDLYGWNTRPEYVSVGVFTAGGMDLVMVFPGVASQIVGFIATYTNPALAALLYMVPMKTLFSVWFGTALLIYALPQIAYTLGYYQGILNTTTGSAREAMLMRDPPLKLLAFGSVGILSGIIVWNVLINRKYFLSTLRMALGKATAEERDLERNEPISYRTAYVMLIVSALLIAILLMGSGASVLSSLIMIFSAALFNMAMARCHGLAGPAPQSWNHGHFFLTLLWPIGSVTGVPTQDYWFSNVLSRTMFTAPQSGLAPGSLYTFDSYRVGQANGANLRNIFVTMALAAIIGPIIATTSMIWLVNRYGGGLPGWQIYATGIGDNGSPTSVNAALGTEPNWIPALIGFVTAAALSYMSYTYVWWPIEPVGLAVSISFGFARSGYWVMFLVAWIAKYMTFKVGGARLYGQYGVPLAAGFLGGNLSCWLFGMAASIIRFFAPW